MAVKYFSFFTLCAFIAEVADLQIHLGCVSECRASD